MCNIFFCRLLPIKTRFSSNTRICSRPVNPFWSSSQPIRNKLEIKIRGYSIVLPPNSRWLQLHELEHEEVCGDWRFVDRSASIVVDGRGEIRGATEATVSRRKPLSHWI